MIRYTGQIRLILFVTALQFATGLQGLPFLKSTTVNSRAVLLKVSNSLSQKTKRNTSDMENICVPQPNSNSFSPFSLKSEPNVATSYEYPSGVCAIPKYSSTVLFQQRTHHENDHVNVKKLSKTVTFDNNRDGIVFASSWRSPSWKLTEDVTSIASVQGMQVYLNRMSEVLSVSITNLSAQMVIAYGTIFELTRTIASESLVVLKQTLLQYWWTFPMLLCFVPLISQSVFQKPAVTPDFWKMVNMQYIAESPDAAMVISWFLGSNIAYIVAALFILIRYPARIVPRGIGLWILSAGLVSTIFHTVQAVGDTIVAEGLCYVDHGIAATAILYFWSVCGKPPCNSKRFWLLAISGLVSLSCPIRPGYAWLHSTWHFLSAGAAIVWVLDGKLRRRQRIFQLIRQKYQTIHQRKRKSSNLLTATL